MTRKSRLGIEPLIDPSAKVTQSKLGRYTEVGARTKITETTMDDYSYIVNDGDIIYTNIGKFCSIAAHVRINPGNHPMQRATQAHFTYRASDYFDDVEDEEEFFDWRRKHSVIIGHDVWIGHGVVVLPGCHIGTGAVIAAGAVVSKDVAPYTIVGGVAAKLIKRRFQDAVAQRLLSLAWWDWPHDQLQHALHDFRHLHVEAFLEKYESR